MEAREAQAAVVRLEGPPPLAQVVMEPLVVDQSQAAAAAAAAVVEVEEAPAPEAGRPPLAVQAAVAVWAPKAAQPRHLRLAGSPGQIRRQQFRQLLPQQPPPESE